MFTTHAQSLNIVGKVVGEDREPLPGASVKVKRTSNVLLTDIDGRFSIQVEKGDTLEFQYVGYVTQVISVNDETPLHVCMIDVLDALGGLICDFIVPPPTKAVYVEAFGASTMFGVNYDSRFKYNWGWGYRVGLSYAYSSHESFWMSGSTNGISVPLEINYLFGKRRSKFEVGAGVSLGYYKENYDYIEFTHEDGSYAKTTPKSRNSFGYFVFFDIGYRFQPIKGFDFRVGITPSFNFGDKRGITRACGLPYLSFGYAFH